MKDWNMRKDGVQPHHAVIGITGKSKNMMVVEPKLAENDEADEPTQELGSNSRR
jgi:hypothetical protein